MSLPSVAAATVVVAVLLTATLAWAAHPASGAVAAPVELRILTTSQDALARSGRVRVRTTSRRQARVRFSASARKLAGAQDRKGRSVATKRTLRMRRGVKRTVALNLTPAGRRAIVSCTQRRLTVTARVLGSRGAAVGARRLAIATAPVTPAGRCVPGPITLDRAQRLGLRVGESTFWDGDTVSGNVTTTEACGTEGPCPAYALKLAEAGARLRVAIDTPSREDSFRVELLDTAGSVVAAVSASNQFNEEAFLEKPAPGDYTVRVVPTGADRAFFRLRAKLEGPEPAAPAVKLPLLPNLKAVPPFEFGFVAPANPGNALYPPDTVNPPASAGGEEPVSCTADEAAPAAAGGFDAKRCLRLTAGPINAGDGPFDLRFTYTRDLTTGAISTESGPIYQVVHYSDGSSLRRPGGTYSFHRTHGHFHDDNILDYQLYKVGSDGRTLTEAGGGTKSGFCPADQLFGEWERFAQDPSGTFGEGDSAAGGNCFSPTDGFIGLTKGWGDVYRWQRPGQYVEFDGNADGLYVVRATVDIQNSVLETDETDNVGYAYIRVVGNEVLELERGQGTDPWDPAKVVFRGSGPASVR